MPFNFVPAVVLATLLILAAPLWSWSRGWGWAPAGMIAIGLVTLIAFSFAVIPAG